MIEIGLVKPRRTVQLRRAVAIAIMLGVLLFPATCSHASGPHSLFIDPRQAAGSHDHAHHATHHASAEAPIGIGHSSVKAPDGSLAWSDLPSAMGMSLATSTMSLILPPQLLAMPAAQTPTTPHDTGLLRGTPVPVDVPPPRAGV